MRRRRIRVKLTTLDTNASPGHTLCVRGQIALSQVAMRTAFFGTPPICVPALHALAETTELVGVVCQPSRPAGRGLSVRDPAAKVAALELGLPVHQPVKVKTGNLDEWLKEREVECAVVLAYGRILPEAVLSAPRLGCLNLHASLLPRYRGAAPINWAIVRGETETGISLMQMDSGLDTGPVFCERRTSIGPEETAGELAVRLGHLAAEVVREDLPRVESGQLDAKPQNEAEATHAPPLKREDGRIDWQRSSTDIANLVRGMAPRPGAYTSISGATLKVLQSKPHAEAPGAPPGTVVIADRGGIFVACGQGRLEILVAQKQGRKALPAGDLVNGRVLSAGNLLGGAD